MAFAGSLNANTLFATLYNQIISLQVFGTGVELNDKLISARKVDGTLYGDKKLYVSTDVLVSYPWSPTSTTYNLLTKKRPTDPKENEITIDTYRQIPVTVDAYLTKQAFSDEGSFSSFNEVVLGWLNKTKEVYEHTKFTADIVISGLAGATALAGIDLKAATLGSSPAPYDLLRWRAQELFRRLGDLLDELNEPSRSFNDNGFLRTYKREDFQIIIPLGMLSSVERHDIPFLFNPDDKGTFDVVQVHWKYFGTKIGTGATSDGTKRAYIEKDFVQHTDGVTTVHCLPGDLIANDYDYGDNEAYTPTYTAAPNLNGSTDMTILLVHKKDYPIMSAFQVGTSFFNAKDLDTNHYLTFGYNDVADAHIGEYALLKVTTDQA